jgi:serine/threonine protein kinase
LRFLFHFFSPVVRKTAGKIRIITWSGVRAAGAKIMGEQSNQVKAIFLEALEQHAPEQWPAFLEQACADDVRLRANVEKLLRAQAEMGSFHEAPRSALLATINHRITEGPGTVIGPYKLLEQIGEGGFGIVFMAEQQEPIRRKVALKVLKPGMDTKQVIARFESERQALALMDHPNIARVLDAGATDSGRPYFVMELVRGVSITEFCDKNHLPPEARLKLFIDVCHAIQHAHHKGVIHRDIKPTNVLVTLHDGVPVVKVIDFGIAKAMVQKLTERTLFTAYGQMIGTPVYMSPEQAEMSGLDIDTRSDVYALGVLLYELLTGTTPLEGRRLSEAGYAELQRLIREEEAPRPSTRLSSLGDSATVLAGNRGLDVHRLAQLLAGDLDWVVMKALEKDRNWRYDTPGNFAADIERYLRREAVLARPPSTVYKVKKFAQRHRTAVLTAAAVAVALLGGTAVATWQAVRVTRAGAAALAAAKAARRAKEDAEAREAETNAVLEFVENQVFAAARPEGRQGGLGHKVTLEQAVEAALPFVEKSFTNQPLIEARLRMTLGQSFWYLGKAKIAADQCQIARTLYTKYLGPDHPETLRSMHNLARSYHALGRYAEALKLNQETLALRQARLGPDHPDTLMSMNNLATNYRALGQYTEALKLYEETLAKRKAELPPGHPDTLHSMHNLAVAYGAVGRHPDALKLREETLALRQARLGPDHPDTLASVEALAASYHALDRYAEALKLREETLALRKAKLPPGHPDTLKSMHGLANTYHALGRYADALKLHEETLALRKANLGPDHRDTLWSMWGVAESLVKLERGAEAVPIIDECVRRAAGKVCCQRGLLPGVMGLRLWHFEKTGDATGCRQTAEMWESLKRADADSLYTAARMRAVTAAVVKSTPGADATRLAKEEADRALAWLNQAVAAGYKNAAHMKQDKDLDVLRDRADFTKLVTMVEGIRD